MQSQLRWTGQIVSMKDHCLPKKLLCGKLSQGKCSQGGQKKHYKDSLKVSMKSFSITPNCLEYLAQDKDKGHEVVKCGAKVWNQKKLSCAGNLEKALPHQPLPPPFLVLTVQDSSTHRLGSLAICSLTDTFLNYKVHRLGWTKKKNSQHIKKKFQKFLKAENLTFFNNKLKRNFQYELIKEYFYRHKK